MFFPLNLFLRLQKWNDEILLTHWILFCMYLLIGSDIRIIRIVQRLVFENCILPKKCEDEKRVRDKNVSLTERKAKYLVHTYFVVVFIWQIRAGFVVLVSAFPSWAPPTFNFSWLFQSLAGRSSVFNRDSDGSYECDRVLSFFICFLIVSTRLVSVRICE